MVGFLFEVSYEEPSGLTKLSILGLDLLTKKSCILPCGKSKQKWDRFSFIFSGRSFALCKVDVIQNVR